MSGQIQIVSLRKAQLCLNPDCEAISNGPAAEACPACGCRGLVGIERFVNAYPIPNWPWLKAEGVEVSN